MPAKISKLPSTTKKAACTVEITQISVATDLKINIGNYESVGVHSGITAAVTGDVKEAHGLLTIMVHEFANKQMNESPFIKKNKERK